MEIARAKKGLEGVVADQTLISGLSADRHRYLYRGYDLNQLSQSCDFEDVVHLLWSGHLPTAEESARLMSREISERNLPPALNSLLRTIAIGSHPANVLRTAISFLGQLEEDLGRRSNDEKIISLWAKTPTMIAAIFRLQQGLEPIAPRQDLGQSENFFYMCFDKMVEDSVVAAFDRMRILYAEHGFNNATFTLRTVASTESEFYAAITAAIASLKGPLHGGAIEELQAMLEDIPSPNDASAWLDQRLAAREKIMGFGHRVYRQQTDLRYDSMKECLDSISAARGTSHWPELVETLVDLMKEKKNLYPNLDLAAGPCFSQMGFPSKYFVCLIIMSRLVGWCAHFNEQMAENRIIRPLAEYVGAPERPLDSQKES